MATRRSLADEVLSTCSNRRRGGLTWFEKLPPDAQEELLAARAAFNPAVHEQMAYYRALKAAAAVRGWEIAGRHGVIAWLLADR